MTLPATLRADTKQMDAVMDPAFGTMCFWWVTDRRHGVWPV